MRSRLIHDSPARLARRRNLWLVAAWGLATALVVVYLATDLPQNWSYALGLRWRTASGIVIAGAAVGVSTVLFQTLTGNRVLTPGIMGFDAIFLAIQLSAVYFLGPYVLVAAPRPILWLIELAIMVACVVTVYYWLFMRRRFDLVTIVLIGLVLGTMLRSLATFVERLLNPEAFAMLQNLLFASFTAIDRQLLLPSAVLVLLAIASIWPIRGDLDALAAGRDTAIALGVSYRRVVLHVVIAISFMIAASTALVGPTMFLGLLVANAAYAMVGHRHTLTIPAVVAISIVTLVGGQLVLDRVLGFTTELSVVVEFIGGITFITLSLRGRTL